MAQRDGRLLVVANPHGEGPGDIKSWQISWDVDGILMGFKGMETLEAWKKNQGETIFWLKSWKRNAESPISVLSNPVAWGNMG